MKFYLYNLSTMTTNAIQTAADIEAIGDAHLSSSLETPMREGAFDLADDEKIEKIEEKFREIMDIMGLDLTDDSLSGTPNRVAKMFVKEIFSGLNPDNYPAVKTFDNKYQYGQMLVERDINLNSTCEHHFLPIIGKAHVAYISSGRVVGLSKINRIVDFYARRPQVQERLTRQIAEDLKAVLDTEDVAVIIDAKHLCVSSRGIQDESSSTVTSEFSGKFQDEDTKKELFAMLNL
ncbi:MAG: GTP cyclohydrolase I FolE [Flavobacteriales bacterium]|nr:GTP cyclohydrolase I FolE [Flavobacteriales bacterium]